MERDGGAEPTDPAEPTAEVVDAEIVPEAALERLPPPLREALREPGVSPQLVSMTVAAFSASWTGPLPPADQIRAYEQVLPGAADRILAMAERQQEHRQTLERVTVNGAANRSRWGLWLGFVIAVIVIGVGAGAIFTGEALAGFAVIVAQAAVLAGVFVYGRIDQRKERVQKNAQTQLPPGQTGSSRSIHP